eukprot:TRINITY_DN5165_c0_g4_i2.p2 TRINITY_DN5165_c0_g4~~TRINITY_DN5165_c0_g4_i2.p2  ORF type:complete len:174 (-),score=27.58 TRINITY_DN5165_c0_g4_i2:471-992(-)
MMTTFEQIKQEVKLVMRGLTHYVRQMPNPKAQKAVADIEKIIKDKDTENVEEVKKILKELEYKYNFLKLAYPSITEPTKEELKAKESGESSTEPSKQFGGLSFSQYIREMKSNPESLRAYMSSMQDAFKKLDPIDASIREGLAKKQGESSESNAKPSSNEEETSSKSGKRLFG